MASQRCSRNVSCCYVLPLNFDVYLDKAQGNRCILADTLVEACVHTIIRIIVICRMFEATSCIVIVPSSKFKA